MGCHHFLFAEGLLLRPIEEAVDRVEKIYYICRKPVEAMLKADDVAREIEWVITQTLSNHLVQTFPSKPDNYTFI